MRKLLFVLALSMATSAHASASRCMDWVDHMQQDFGVVVHKVSSPSWFHVGLTTKLYRTHNPQWEVIGPRDIEVSSSLDQRVILIRASGFSTRLILDKNSNCQNVQAGAGFAQLPSKLRERPDVKKAEYDQSLFWYDYQLCQRVLRIVDATPGKNWEDSVLKAKEALLPFVKQSARPPFAAMFTMLNGNPQLIASQCSGLAGATHSISEDLRSQGALK